jgi:hypothetical protein
VLQVTSSRVCWVVNDSPASARLEHVLPDQLAGRDAELREALSCGERARAVRGHRPDDHRQLVDDAKEVLGVAQLPDVLGHGHGQADQGDDLAAFAAKGMAILQPVELVLGVSVAHRLAGEDPLGRSPGLAALWIDLERVAPYELAGAQAVMRERRAIGKGDGAVGQDCPDDGVDLLEDPEQGLLLREGDADLGGRRAVDSQAACLPARGPEGAPHRRPGLRTRSEPRHERGPTRRGLREGDTNGRMILGREAGGQRRCRPDSLLPCCVLLLNDLPDHDGERIAATIEYQRCIHNGIRKVRASGLFGSMILRSGRPIKSSAGSKDAISVTERERDAGLGDPDRTNIISTCSQAGSRAGARGRGDARATRGWMAHELVIFTHA